MDVTNNGKGSYPDLKWLMKNGNNVLIRNLISEKIFHNEMIMLPQSRLNILIQDKDNSTYKLLYKSNLASQGCNPSWSFFGMIPTIHAMSYLDTYKLRFEITSKDCSFIVCHVDVDLSKLILLKSNILDGSIALPVNFFIINIEDSLYTTEKYQNIIYSKLIPYLGPYFTINDDESDISLKSNIDHSKIDNNSDINIITNNDNNNNNLTSIKDSTTANNNKSYQNLIVQPSLNTSKDSIKQFKDEILQAYHSSKVSKLKSIKESRQSEYEKLKDELNSIEIAYLDEEEIYKQEIEEIININQLTININKCKEYIHINKDIESILNHKNDLIIKEKFLLHARQIKLLYELQIIYPIEKLDNGDYSIRGIEVPNDLQTKDEEQIACALGYIVHLLLLTSKYLEVPLRYQMLFMGSRSFIRDPIVGNGGTLPLFRRNVEKERFDRAIIWLKRVLEQLLLTRGIIYENHHNILYYIDHLFKHEINMKLSI